MSEVLVTNDRAMPVPVVMTGLPRWEVWGEIDIRGNQESPIVGSAEFTIPANRLFIVTFVSAEGEYHGTGVSQHAALKVFSVESAAGTTFKGAQVYPTVRRIEKKVSAVCEMLDFVIEGGKKPNKVTARLDKDINHPGDNYTVRYVLHGYLQVHLAPSQALGPVHPLK